MAKFFRRGVSKIKFLPAVTGTSPTRAEITAGTDLTPAIATVNGFKATNAPIAVENLADRFTPQIAGPDTVDASSLVFHDDDTTTTIRTAVANGTAGHLLFMPYGDVPTKRCEVWPVTSTGLNDEWTTGAESAKSEVTFVITGVPVQNGVIPS